MPVLICAAAVGQLAFLQNVNQDVGKTPIQGPLSMRKRTTRLIDPLTGFMRSPPVEADIALDIFQRTFPEARTKEHILIKRWENLATVFGGSEAANQLIEAEPCILRNRRNTARNAFHFLSMHLGPKVARQTVFESPWLLTRLGKQMKYSLPALMNVLGSKKDLQALVTKYPSLCHVPVGCFYWAMPNMIAVTGNADAAMEVAREAMDSVAASPYKSAVPECYPVLVAIFGGVKEAHKAIDREPLLLKWYGEQFLGKLATLRQLLGIEGAQQALRKAPYMLLHEDQKKTKKFKQAFEAIERFFGTEETRRLVGERPELLTLGSKLPRALGFAEKKYGSRELVRDEFDKILKRTGLLDHLRWETKQRPRHGPWTPSMGRKPQPFHGPWSPLNNPLGKGGPARGPWEDVDEDVLEAELVSSTP